MLFFWNVLPLAKDKDGCIYGIYAKNSCKPEKILYNRTYVRDEQERTIMGVVMKEQDKRAIESMCRCGLDLEGVISVFPTFPKEDVMAIYNAIRGLDAGNDGELHISMNCS